MKIFATICALVAIALAILLGINLRTEASHDTEQAQALQTATVQLQRAQQELQNSQAQLRQYQAELDAHRSLLAQGKTRESAQTLQIAENELKIRQLNEQLANSKQAYATLEKLHREVKTELVQLHTSGGTTNLDANRLKQYEQEIADLQRQLRDLQGTR